MAQKNKTQFGVWMDSHSATIVGRQGFNGDFVILENIVNSDPEDDFNEIAPNPAGKSPIELFFKEIAENMPNVGQVHLTGTGQYHKQFIKFLADTHVYRNVQSTESKSAKMDDERLAQFIKSQFKVVSGYGLKG